MKRDGVPRPGRGVLVRALIAGILTISLSATAVASAVLLEIDELGDALTRDGRNEIDIPEVTRAEAGDPRTFLILGSDERYADRKLKIKPRSDSILLLRIGGGHNATLSIPRDTVVDIPGHGRNKINAAYAFGGPALAIRTVEQFLGINVNHLVEVNFENFPQLIDALGGVTYKGGCVVSKINGGTRNGGYTLRLKKGTHEINGKQALALARTTNEQLSGALTSNRDIGVPMGVLMQRHKLTREQAFDLLRVASQNGNRKLRDLAVEVGDTGELKLARP